MPTMQPKRIGGVALAAALVVAALVAATAPHAVARHGEDHPVVPGGQESNNCSAEFTLEFDTLESESLDRVADDTEDSWVTDVPDGEEPVQLDVTKTSGDDLEVAVYNKTSGSCNLVDSANVGSGAEVDGLDDNQKYWSRVSFVDSTDNQADYDIIMEPE